MTEDSNQSVTNCGSSNCKRRCGCAKTSDKLKQILETSFPNPQPHDTAVNVYQVAKKSDKASGYAYGQGEKMNSKDVCGGGAPVKHKMHGAGKSKPWRIVSELVSLVQLSVTATALALYYLIYCYMQLIYYTLRSALYFHNADGPMKITIGVVTLTSLIVAFNILMRMEGIIGIVY